MWDNFKSWYARPYSDGMSATDWFFFAGLMVVIMILWRLILSHISEAID